MQINLRRFILTGVISILFISFVLLSVIVPIKAGAPPQTFAVNLTITNVGPTITAVNVTPTSITPSEDSNASVTLIFNITDSNGMSDINAASANVNYTIGGTTDIAELTNTSVGDCRNQTLVSGSNLLVINCSIQIQYYNRPGTYILNATIQDKSAATARNDTVTFTVNTLSAITLASSRIEFTGSAGTSNNPSVPNNQTLRNTGNANYSLINITAFNLNNTVTTGDEINATNISLSINPGFGNEFELSNNSMLSITNTTGNFTTLRRGNSSGGFTVAKINSTRELFMRVDISGGKSGTYNSTANWQITVSTE